MADVAILLPQYVILPSGQPLPPGPRDYSRFDLNGDGFTGGSDKTAPFPLEPGAQFGAPNLTDVVQTIERVPVHFDETRVTDLQLLCDYAYSSLFVGNDADRGQRADMLGFRPCLKLNLKVDFAATLDSGTATPLTLQAACGAPVVCDTGIPSLQIDVAVDGGTADVVSGVTDAGGFFRTLVTAATGSTSVSLRFTAHRPGGGSVVADNTLHAQVNTPSCGRVEFNQPLGLSESDLLAFANRIKVLDRVCTRTPMFCYPGPPWHTP